MHGKNRRKKGLSYEIGNYNLLPLYDTMDTRSVYPSKVISFVVTYFITL
jgi:hypothetical protein